MMNSIPSMKSSTIQLVMINNNNNLKMKTKVSQIPIIIMNWNKIELFSTKK